MKKIIILLLFICFLIITVFKVDASKVTFPLIGKIIVIDPGHGGVDNGASHLSVKEDNINLAISLFLKEELERNGAAVILIREGDYDLSKPNALYRKKNDFDNRIRIINNSNADLYLSIHLNYFNQSAYYGPQVFYTENIKSNKKIAKILQKELNKSLKSKRNIKKTNNSNYMFGKLNVPGVLIECGFLSNYNDRYNLQKKDYQKKVSLTITKGIINYYK
ncbi:MAG: N-acetylmuramoyl-L-alanine amidase [Bacilli bacterium]|nr:N-acetylmuramoyl-L-alanine amidase [Bacilli bacterium]